MRLEELIDQLMCLQEDLGPNVPVQFWDDVFDEYRVVRSAWPDLEGEFVGIE